MYWNSLLNPDSIIGRNSASITRVIFIFITIPFFIILSGLISPPPPEKAGLINPQAVQSRKTQYVVFKFDDLRETNWKNWKTVTDIIIAKNITAEIGLFVKSLTVDDPEYLSYVQSLVDDPKHFEIWMHGWTGDAKEFFDTDYELQLDHFRKSRTTMLMKYDYILRNYGDHYYGGNQHTVRIVNEDPFIRGWIYYQNRNKKLITGLDPEKEVMPALNVYMETVTGVVSFQKYLSDWARYKADTLSYVLIQGHPWGYRTDSLRNEFTQIVDDLLSKGVTFTHCNEYNRMLKGFISDITPPSAPKKLKVVRLDDANVKLSWKASSDSESDVDCYKIYRDGICIDLSATNSYTDAATGSHTYQVSAVNRNELVSKKSSIIKS